MAKIFITGIAGFLGSHLADFLAARGHMVDGCDDLSTGDLQNLVPLVTSFQSAPDVASWVVNGSIHDLTPADLAGVDVVYHLAAAAYEGVSSFSPAFITHNVFAGSANVFSAAIAAGVRRIVFTSSMARYGIGDPPFSEYQTPCPVDPYGIAKEAAERLLINLCETHGVEWSIAVPHNIYGPRQKYDDPFRNVAAIFANRLLQGNQPIIYGSGLQKRCFSYVDDVVPYLARLGFDERANGEILNLGPDGGEVAILELGRLVAHLARVRYDPIFLPGRPREVRVALCSSGKLRDLFGFEPRTSLINGLVALVDYVRERGPKPFNYHLNLEIASSLAPKTWVERTM